MAKRSFSDESGDESEEEYSEHSDDDYGDNDVDSAMDHHDEFQKEEHDGEDVSVASSHRSEHDNFLGTQPDLSGKTKILMDSNESALKNSAKLDGHHQNQDTEKKEEKSKKVSKLKLKAKSKDRKADSFRDETKEKIVMEKKGTSSGKGLVYDLTVLEDETDHGIGIPTVKNDPASSNVKSKAANSDEHHPTVSTLGITKKKKASDGSTLENAPPKKSKLDSSESSSHKSMPIPNTASTSDDNAPKLPKKKKLTFQKQVLSHLLNSLKPFTLKTLATEMKTTDTALHHLMLSLLDKQVVRRKEVGNKIKKEIYWIDIEKASKELYGTNMSNEAERMQADVELKQCQQKELELRKILSDFSSELSNEEVSLQIQRFDEEVTQLQARVQEVKDRISKDASKVVSSSNPRCLLFAGMKQNPSKKPLTKNQLKKNINSMRIEWRSRKDKCVDFVENFADALEKKPKDIYKLMEIETDEMVGVQMPPKQTLDE